ncbi:hypothetical protein ECANGB1_1968 [Enterospora canceri]|uniref:Uncharacterized protein n=1 Tax=Enterospora canceri TaxID=1081671 RepID=A0A1Y1S5Z8_9MICR|nr:hypothetical protein ECANGB1_1968 [Enterospora canceri]
MDRYENRHENIQSRIKLHSQLFVVKNTLLFVIRLSLNRILPNSLVEEIVIGIENVFLLNFLVFGGFVYTLITEKVETYRSTLIILSMFYLGILSVSFQTLIALVKEKMLLCIILLLLIFTTMTYEMTISFEFYTKLWYITTCKLSHFTKDAQIIEAYQKRNSLIGLRIGYSILLGQAIYMLLVKYVYTEHVPMKGDQANLNSLSETEIFNWLYVVTYVIILGALNFRINEEYKKQRTTLMIIILFDFALTIENVIVYGLHNDTDYDFSMNLIIAVIYDLYGMVVIWNEYHSLDSGLKTIFEEMKKKKQLVNKL